MTEQAQSSEPITLLILGAGCSACYGYPCARDMVSELKTFSAAVERECPRLHELVVRTIEAFERLQAIGTPALTLDDLAWLVHQGKLGDNRDPAKEAANFRLVEVAKVAVAALFLSKESEASKSGLAGHRALMRRALGSEFGGYYQIAARRTPYRVLTFNYDRLFELAYRQHFNVDLTQAFYGPTGLNSGVFTVVPKRVEVDLDHFSFLKLHGSVGVYSYDNYGQCDHRHSIPDPAQPPPIKDDQFFYRKDHHLRPGQPNPPLIVFPHEKDFLREYPNSRLSYRVYIPTIWKAAHHFANQASQIEIIGYSCPEPDFPALRLLLEAATQCERIIIKNPHAKTICDRLRVRMPKQARLFEPFEGTFEDG
jgi:hypothetical protein